MVEMKPHTAHPLSVLSQSRIVGILNLNVKIACKPIRHELRAIGAGAWPHAFGRLRLQHHRRNDYAPEKKQKAKQTILGKHGEQVKIKHEDKFGG